MNVGSPSASRRRRRAHHDSSRRRHRRGKGERAGLRPQHRRTSSLRGRERRRPQRNHHPRQAPKTEAELRQMRQGLVSLAHSTAHALALLSHRLARRRRAALAGGGDVARRHRGLESGLRGLERLKARTDTELQALIDSIDAAAASRRADGADGAREDGAASE